MKKVENILWGIVLIVIGLIVGGNTLGLTNIDIFFQWLVDSLYYCAKFY